MTALLGRSTSQLIGHSLPASLGGNSALGRTLLAREPFANLEMELKTRRGTRWISLAGDPIIDMAGQFQGFRGVGSDITEVRKTQERLTNLANMDVLSGLPNRGRVRQLLGEALSTARRDQCALRDHVPRSRRLQAGQRHVRPPQGRRGAEERLAAPGQGSRRYRHVGRMGGDEFAIVIKRRAEAARSSRTSPAA
jgi:predicted signal transduction protein with EAL and GGDEF domain